MMVKEIFDELEEYQFAKKLFTMRVTKEDITSKDGRVLSQRQANCLYNYFDLNERETLNYIQTNNYEDISKAIEEALGQLKESRE